MSKRVIVVGGGIAGLSAGVYAKKCGFDVTILESHSIAGGNCTSWRRGDYLFEGGMHWLTGSKNGEPVNKLWRHIGALDNSVEIHTREPFAQYDYKGTPIKLSRNIDLTMWHLAEHSSKDFQAIRAMSEAVRRVSKLYMPISDLRGVKATKKQRIPASLAFNFLTTSKMLKAYSKVSREEYIAQFKHEGIQETFRAFVEEKSGFFPFLMTFGTLARGDGGFPEGGSLPFVQRIVDTFERLGGKLLLGTPVERVIVENGKAVGVMVAGQRMDTDFVIVTTDTMALEQLFEVPPKASWLDEMRRETRPTMCVHVALGINADLSAYAERYVWKLEEPIKLADETIEYLGFNNYAGDTTYNPPGKTAVTIHLTGNSYDFWKAAKAEGCYADEKQKIADKVIVAIEKQIPETKGKVEVVDVATPLTYERYCGNWKGSWMTEMTTDKMLKMKPYPAVIDGLSGLYLAGQRLMPPGGLPVALMTGRMAVQHLCKDTGKLFVSEE
ncbi:MAG: NAD(P)/FAD-dependent oxidoreductase [Oscillospiraceae bacterium]|nr:NAD(P)/FAD-dependent oxidoreductase [Oscillospiraceae bacterium]